MIQSKEDYKWLGIITNIIEETDSSQNKWNKQKKRKKNNDKNNNTTKIINLNVSVDHVFRSMQFI